jgi:hypothetical protein
VPGATVTEVTVELKNPPQVVFEEPAARRWATSSASARPEVAISISLISETRASVVSIRPGDRGGVLISACLVTLAGSMTPALTRSSNLPVWRR